MNLNITEIASAKINEMHDNGEIKKRIEDGISRSVFEAIDSATRDYAFKQEIENKIEKELSVMAKSIDFSAYTSFLTARLEDMIDKHVKKDLTNQINDEFKKIYLNKPEQITLTEILDAYKEWLCGKLDDQERYDNESFDIEVDRQYSEFIYVKCGIIQNRSYGKRIDRELSFSFVYDDKEKNIGHLHGATIENINLKEAMKIDYISDFEAMMISALFNETPIVIDIDAEEYDNYLYNED